MGDVIIGFFGKALDISGAQQVTVNFSTPISAGGEYAELKSPGRRHHSDGHRQSDKFRVKRIPRVDASETDRATSVEVF
jgi:hypothetical protein